MKGLTPVVSVVLIIGMMVVASVAFYYWIMPYTGKKATPETTYYSMHVESCNRSHITVRNTGLPRFHDANVSVYDSTGSKVAWFYIDSLNTSESKSFQLNQSLELGQEYTLRYEKIPGVTFVCNEY